MEVLRRVQQKYLKFKEAIKTCLSLELPPLINTDHPLSGWYHMESGTACVSGAKWLHCYMGLCLCPGDIRILSPHSSLTSHGGISLGCRNLPPHTTTFVITFHNGISLGCRNLPPHTTTFVVASHSGTSLGHMNLPSHTTWHKSGMQESTTPHHQFCCGL